MLPIASCDAHEGPVIAFGGPERWRERSIPPSSLSRKCSGEAISARGGTPTVLAAHPDDSQGQIGVRGLLPRGGEERALRRGRTATLLRHLEPPLHRPRALEQSLDLAELLV